jgi:hypothetical protein
MPRPVHVFFLVELGCFDRKKLFCSLPKVLVVYLVVKNGGIREKLMFCSKTYMIFFESFNEKI